MRILARQWSKSGPFKWLFTEPVDNLEYRADGIILSKGSIYLTDLDGAPAIEMSKKMTGVSLSTSGEYMLRIALSDDDLKAIVECRYRDEAEAAEFRSWAEQTLP